MLENLNKKNSCLLAMSGGIDSTAAAILLKDKGYEVTGITYNLFDSNDFILDRTSKIAKKLGISHFVVDERKSFKKNVIKPFVNEYLLGNTPNPCVYCNKFIKFLILEKYRKKGCFDFMATGHYVQKKFYKKDDKKILTIKKAKLLNRDQSYYLYNLNSEMISKCLFPLGEITHKRFAEELLKSELINPYYKPESRGICFAPEGHYNYLKNKIKENCSGFFVDNKKNKIFNHDAYYKYTIGQKKNLGFLIESGKCVIDIDYKTGEVKIGDERLTFKNTLKIFYTNWIIKPELNKIYDVNIFKWGLKLKCLISKINELNNSAEINFFEPVRAASSGQSAVIYDGEYLIGGGIVKTKI